MNKYHARRTYSSLCGREFSSLAEAVRGEELALLEKAGEITDLEYQVKFVLSQVPRVTITVDFAYTERGERIYSDVKGVLTRDFRTKMCWVQEKFGIQIRLVSYEEVLR